MITKGYNKEKIKEICTNCGSKSVKSSYSYLDVSNFRSKEKFACYIFDDVAFFAGVICKKHFRLLEIAVKTDQQGNHYGSKMLLFLKQLCKKWGLEKITFRCARNERAVEFYLKNGAKVLGAKEEDYEMEIYV